MSFARFTRLAFVAAPLAFAPALALAQTAAPAAATSAQPSKEAVALARQLVEASGAAASFKNVVPYFIDQAKSAILQSNMDLSKMLTEIGNNLKPEFEKRIDDLVTSISASYASKFTMDEMNKILAFYRSAEGKKLVDTMPSILDESYSKSQEWGQTLSRDLLARFREEMAKRGIKN